MAKDKDKKKDKKGKEKDKDKKKEKKDKDPKDPKADKKKKKSGPPRLPPEFELGARVIVLEHEVESMVGKRGVSLGSFILTDTPRKRVRVAIKLEAPLKKGCTVDTSKVEPATSVARQRAFAGSVDAKFEPPAVHVPSEHLQALSPPGRADDDAVLRKATGAKFWFSKLFGSATAKLLIKARSSRRVYPTPPPDPKKKKKKKKKKEGGEDQDQEEEEEEATDEKKKKDKVALAAAVAGEDAAESAAASAYAMPLPGATEVGHLLHELFEYPTACRAEQVAVMSGGYRTVASVRAMTPTQFARMFGRSPAPSARMAPPEVARLREALAPKDFDARERFPLFASF